MEREGKKKSKYSWTDVYDMSFELDLSSDGPEAARYLGCNVLARRPTWGVAIKRNTTLEERRTIKTAELAKKKKS